MNESEEQKRATAQLGEARAELETLLRLLQAEAKVEAFLEGESEILLHVESPDAARLIGRGAQALDALQYVLNRILFRRWPDGRRCIVDVERYRERRKDRLLKEAYEAAEKVRRTGRPVRLAPMRPAERRIVHQALKDERDLETVSEEPDAEGRKRVVVRRRSGGHPAASPTGLEARQDDQPEDLLEEADG